MSIRLPRKAPEIMARSTPPIPFLDGLGFPQPASLPTHPSVRQPTGQSSGHLPWRLGTSRRSASSTSWIVAAILIPIFIVPGIMLVLLLLALSIVAIPIALTIEKSRRRILGWFIGRRHPFDVEFSKDPLLPGESFRGTIRFKRPGPLETLKITVQCIEEAKYRRGTTTYTDRHTAFEEVLVDAKNPASDTINFEGTIPADAMHTFASSNNSIDWNIKVVRTFQGGNIEERTYLFDVYTTELEQAILQYRQKNPSLQHPLHGGTQ